MTKSQKKCAPSIRAVPDPVRKVEYDISAALGTDLEKYAKIFRSTSDAEWEFLDQAPRVERPLDEKIYEAMSKEFMRAERLTTNRKHADVNSERFNVFNWVDPTGKKTLYTRFIYNRGSRSFASEVSSTKSYDYTSDLIPIETGDDEQCFAFSLKRVKKFDPESADFTQQETIMSGLAYIRDDGRLITMIKDTNGTAPDMPKEYGAIECYRPLSPEESYKRKYGSKLGPILNKLLG